MSLIEWQEKEFNDFVADGGSGVVEFGAPWCGACKATEPQIEEVAMKHTDLKFAKIDVGKNSSLASKMGVMSLPNVIIFNGGKVKEQMIGMTPSKVLEEKLAKI
ncbi:TPA: thioredoxin [Candidatus Berkelbacteria bacterium]|uniref:Thioredoxin n=1 Tax=Berkelbacteria bacterium GW2011_GWE1_39_12 TaxID=1618337 RepID=A0A0G4B335_9BACT|nr:MAG: thioredoxin [Berkelbacteria bacterium GW2011_GWE1_39_12]HBO60081.1 thioredoxin [Candidatus Berkelbacteria bacterium]